MYSIISPKYLNDAKKSKFKKDVRFCSLVLHTALHTQVCHA